MFLSKMHECTCKCHVHLSRWLLQEFCWSSSVWGLSCFLELDLVSSSWIMYEFTHCTTLHVSYLLSHSLYFLVYCSPSLVYLLTFHPSPHTSHTFPHPHFITAGIPWMMVTELFLQEARPVAVAIGTTVNWFANFTVALAFPYILVRGRERRGGQYLLYP